MKVQASDAGDRSGQGIPPLAGLCSMEEAMREGIPIDDCVDRLKRFHYALHRLHEILLKRLVAEPEYEVKMGFSHHAYLCAEHVAALRKRVAEMREPPLGLDRIPHPALEIFFDEICAAPSAQSLLEGVYGKALPAMKAGLERHMRDTNRLVDAPSVRVCRFALLEIEEMLAYGQQALAAVTSEALSDERLLHWHSLLDNCLSAAGGLDGTDEPAEMNIERMYSAVPYVFDRVPRRDERFPDPYNMAVNAEAFVYDESYPPEAKILMLFYKRLREIDVPEMMASIIVETEGKPWEYYLDMSRQLWDEARHAMMGEVGFASLGLDWPSLVRINFTWSLGLNTQLTPLERHAVLYFIEQGLMPKTGKRYEWEIASASGNRLAMLFQDYDWADEVLHARIGKEWYVSEMKGPGEARRYGDECWSKVLMDWKSWRDEGLTGHYNWWPGLYRAACERWRTEPDPHVLAYGTSYETTRADLKAISASG
jgi:hypothetical protein